MLAPVPVQCLEMYGNLALVGIFGAIFIGIFHVWHSCATEVHTPAACPP